MRPDWNDWFMSICFLVSQRSLDPDTKHGCVVVSDDNTILSVGYNSPPRGCDDSKVPLTRPDKYDWFIHSEEAAILNAARVGVKLKGSTFYVTGIPCEKCLRQIINVGAKKVIYGNVKSNCVTETSFSIHNQMLLGRDMSMVHHPCSNVLEIFQGCLGYIEKYNQVSSTGG